MKAKKIPQRTCIGCRNTKPKKELIRIVRTPELELLVDSSGKVNGRGAYICPQIICLEIACTSKRLSQALDLKVGSDELEQLKAELTESIKVTHADKQ